MVSKQYNLKKNIILLRFSANHVYICKLKAKSLNEIVL